MLFLLNKDFACHKIKQLILYNKRKIEEYVDMLHIDDKWFFFNTIFCFKL